MKKWIGLLAGLAVVLVLAWLAFKWQRPEPAEDIAQPQPEAQSQIMIDVKLIDSVELTNDKGKIRFEKESDGNWWIVEPLRDMPEMMLLGGLLDELYKTYPLRVIPKEGQEPLSKYGLDPPMATLKFRYLDGSSKVLLFGNLNPSSSAIYSKFVQEPDILLIQTRLRMFVQSGLNYYRYRRIMGVNRENPKELTIVISDPELREGLGVPEKRRLALQNTAQGKAWIMVEPEPMDINSHSVGMLLNWMEKVSLAMDIKDVTKQQLAAWRLDPPRAYWEIVYPDRTIRVMVGKEEGDFVYLFQPEKMVVLGYKKDTIYGLLAQDFRVTKLMSLKEPSEFDRIEVLWPSGKNAGYTLAKINDKLWSVDGDPKKSFSRGKVNWVTKEFRQTDVIGYVNERPVDLGKYGLQKPVLEVKCFMGDKLMRDFLVGPWDKKTQIAYIYDPVQDLLAAFPKDLAEWVPPDAQKFLVKLRQKEKNDEEQE